MIKPIELTKYISNYKKLNPDEHDTCALFVDLLKSSHCTFHNRDNFTPGHITASSFVITADQKFLLLIYHKTLKRWLQPGGHVDTNDKSINGAATRELFEETSLAPPLKCLGLIDLDIHTIPQKNQLPEHQHFDMRFLFISEKKNVKAGSDVSKAKWVSVAKLTPDNTEESILRILRKTPKALK